MVQQHPAHRALAASAFILIALATLALGFRPNKPFGGGGIATQATITKSTLNGGARFAEVQFLTSAGQQVVTQVTVCHHQSYAAGNGINIVYNAASPMQAIESEMIGSHFQPPPAVVLEVIGGVVLLGLILRRRRHTPTPAVVALPTPLPVVAMNVEDDQLDDELLALLAAPPAAEPAAAPQPELIDA